MWVSRDFGSKWLWKQVIWEQLSLEACDFRGIWFLKHFTLGAFGFGSIWLWKYLTLELCDLGSIWHSEHVTLGPCDFGSIWLWERVTLELCYSGSIWHSEDTTLGPCNIRASYLECGWMWLWYHHTLGAKKHVTLGACDLRIMWLWEHMTSGEW